MDKLSTREYVCIFIDKWLKEHKISTQRFADEIGVSFSSARRWRYKECAPDINLFSKICEYMNVPLTELMGFKSNRELSPREIELLNRYMNDESFRTLCDKYRNDEEFRVSISTLIKIINKNGGDN